ncbi:sensor histidine kinase LiaS [mine drainage metagenome]|uniref:histidine kinase n=1 Tax=mine drainage metagenome TaxID=410659 RepID=A0A1J5T6Z0_9ZZZZ
MKIFISVAFIFTIAILLTFFLVTYYSLNKTLSQSNDEKEVLKMMLHLDNLQTYSTDIESLERPHQIEKDPQKFFIRFATTEENYKKQLDELYALKDIKGLPDSIFLDLKILSEKRLAFSKQLLLLSAKGDLNTVSELLVKEDQFDTPVKNEIKNISDSGRAILKKFQEEYNSKARETYQLFGLLSVIAFVVISFLFYRIWKNVDIVSEKKFLQNLVEHLPGIFYMYNRNGKFKMWNKNFEKALGYSFEEIKQIHPVDFFETEEGKVFCRKRIEKIFNGENPGRGEVTLFSKQKERIPFMLDGWMFDYNGELNLVGAGLDLREIKRSQEIVYKEKDFLDTLVNNLPGIFVMYTQEGKLLKWNKNCESIFGYTAEEIKQTNVLDLIPEEDVEFIKNRGTQIVNEKKLFTREGDLVTKNKERIPFQLRTWPIDYKGEMVIVSLGFDISETRKKQLLLNKLNDIIAHANTFAAITDIKTRKTIFINNAFRKALEIGDDEGISLHEFHSEDEHQYFKDAIMPQILRHGIWNGEYSFRSRSNKKIIVIAEWILHKDEAGNAKEISVTAIDITELKHSQEESNRFMQISNNSIAFIGISNLNRVVFYLNKSMRHAFAIPDDADLSAYKPSYFYSEKGNKILEQAIKEMWEKEYWAGENEMQTPDGRIIPVMQTLLVIKDYSGKPQYISTTAIDISELKQKQTENIKIGNELRQLSIHLQNVIEEERATMAKEIHDEFGQNLVALSMNAAWLKTNLQNKDKKTEDVLNEQVSISVDAIQKSRLLFNSLRPYMLEEIGVVAAIRWHAQTLLKQSTIKVEIRSNVEDERFPKEISLCLYRIFQESLNNVIHHSKATKVTIDIFKKINQTINMTIEDNGIGFDTTNINIINNHGLLGIRERVYAQQGKYLLNSEIGKGTRIQIEIPLFNYDMDDDF